MKLATLLDGTRDGQLVVVSQDLQRMLPVSHIAKTMQGALDVWSEVSEALAAEYASLNSTSSKGQPVNVSKLHSPLPRAYEWIDGSAFINHVLLVRKARKAEPPKNLRSDALVYQGGSGTFLRPHQPIPLHNEAWGCDFESEIAVVLGDTPLGTKAHEAHKYVKLIMLCNDVTLRNLIPNELEKGFGFFQSKPSSAFSPMAITPDELGQSWKDGRVHLPLKTFLNGSLFGQPNAGPEMHFSFFDLIEHICKTRAYTAGTILGSGTISNENRATGSSCLVEKRMIETIDTGEPSTAYLKSGDRVKIEMHDLEGRSIFGSIDQVVTQA
jgi:fumarylacetoacetate (FAA) hydrolase